MASLSPSPSSNAYTQHKTHTTIFTPPLQTPTPPKIIRIHVADPDATDSSGDENDPSLSKPKKICTYINQKIIQPSSTRKNNTAHLNNSDETPLPAVKNPRRKKQKLAGKSRTAKKPRKSGEYWGVRQRRWGSWAAEIRVPVTNKRLWLGTYKTAEEAAMVYDHAAIKLRGPDAITNFGQSTDLKNEGETTQCLVSGRKETGDKSVSENFSGSGDFSKKDPGCDPVKEVVDPNFGMFDFEKECKTMFGGSMNEVFGSDLLVCL